MSLPSNPVHRRHYNRSGSIDQRPETLRSHGPAHRRPRAQSEPDLTVRNPKVTFSGVAVHRANPATCNPWSSTTPCHRRWNRSSPVVSHRSDTHDCATTRHTPEGGGLGGVMPDRSRDSLRLSAALPPQAMTPQADSPICVRGRTRVRATMCERRHRQMSVPPTGEPAVGDWLTPGNQRRLPEVRCLSAKSVEAIVLRRFTSPTPSALGVSHPLSGLIPPRPRGFVSRHIRS